MEQFKLAFVLTTLALIANLDLVIGVSPQLVPLPDKPSPTGATQKSGEVQMIQAQINAHLDSNQEIDRSVEAKVVEVPITLEAVAKTGQSTSYNETNASEVGPKFVKDLNAPAVSDSENMYRADNGSDMDTNQSIAAFDMRFDFSTPQGKINYCALVPGCSPSNDFDCSKMNCLTLLTSQNITELNLQGRCPKYCNSAIRLEVCLLMLASILIISTSLTCSNPLGKGAVVF